MEEDFFETIEKRLQAPTPPRLKKHLKFHHLDNIQVAALIPAQCLSYERFTELEDFGRRILFQIIEPEEFIEYYGHFKRKTGLFAFTVGERIYLNSVIDVCKQICKEMEETAKTSELQNNEGHSSGSS
ncbi:hypothetical protein WA026_023087 [Henosepilachna vigintioctopunctata]|uniref:Uncharacterized protein n=1 Tax=Henosepilachna vigintioctopunctata TaxID=420089 RepID=A0AAW1U4J0_9CUCU